MLTGFTMSEALTSGAGARLGIDVGEEKSRDHGHEQQDNPHSHDLSSEQRPTIPAPLRLSKPVT